MPNSLESQNSPESQNLQTDTFYIIDKVESGTLELEVPGPNGRPARQLHKMLFFTATNASNGLKEQLMLTGNPEQLAEIIVKALAVLSLDQDNDVPSMLRRWADNMDLITIMDVEGDEEK